MTGGELRLRRRALAETPAIMRHALSAFLRAIDVDDDAQIDVITAVGEALANAVEHAYPAGDAGVLEMAASAMTDAGLIVTVSDRGTFGQPHGDPDRGFGLRIMRSIAQSVHVETKREGTTVRMSFDSAFAT